MSSLRFVVVTALSILAISCGGDASSPASPSPAPTPGDPASSVSIPTGAESLGNRAYAPDELDVTAGTTVTWTNTDIVPHTSTSDGNQWDSGSVAPGKQFAFTFQTPGTFEYHCTIHPGMVGTIVVR